MDAEGRPFEPGAEGERRSICARAGPDAEPTCVVTEATDHGVKVGFATERLARLAALHESGTKHMPARPFLGLSRAMVDRVVRFLKARMGK